MNLEFAYNALEAAQLRLISLRPYHRLVANVLSALVAARSSYDFDYARRMIEETREFFASLVRDLNSIRGVNSPAASDAIVTLKSVFQQVVDDFDNALAASSAESSQITG